MVMIMLMLMMMIMTIMIIIVVIISAILGRPAAHQAREVAGRPREARAPQHLILRTETYRPNPGVQNPRIRGPNFVSILCLLCRAEARALRGQARRRG